MKVEGLGVALVRDGMIEVPTCQFSLLFAPK